jgi:hypothetical protein
MLKKSRNQEIKKSPEMFSLTGDKKCNPLVCEKQFGQMCAQLPAAEFNSTKKGGDLTFGSLWLGDEDVC